MKQRILVTIVLVLSLLFANGIPNKRQTKEVFKKLMQNEFGRDIYASIQLELQAGNEKNLVDTILGMLYDLRDQFTLATEGIDEELEQRQYACDEKLVTLQTEIENVEEKIAKANSQLPIQTEAVDTKVAQILAKQSQVDEANVAVDELNRKNDEAILAYNQSVEDHDNMIDALQRAKELITQLVATGFLQKSRTTNAAFAQLSQHQKSTLERLPNHQQIGVFNVLIKLAKDVGIQADQEQVADIIAIIDELIKAEQETADLEQQVERKRQERYQFDLNRAKTIAQTQDAAIKFLQAEIASEKVKLSELETDIKSHNEYLESKQAQLDLQSKTCEDSINNIQHNLTSNAEILALIQQVIEIFESEDIQTIKSIAEEL